MSQDIIYVMDLVWVEGLSIPTGIRGYVIGSDLDEIIGLAHRWRDLQIETVRANCKMPTEICCLGKHLSVEGLQRFENIDLGQDIRFFLGNPPVTPTSGPSRAAEDFATQMKKLMEGS